MQQVLAASDERRMPIAWHLTAHTRSGWRLVVSPSSARWLWLRLRRAYPDALACTLMPDHLHLIVSALCGPEILSRILQHHARRFAGVRLWHAAVPQPITTTQILRRAVGYSALNPPRKGLVDDPLLWPWSTLRDIVGGIAEPWVDATRLAAALGEARRGFAPRLHAGITADASCSETARRFPALPDRWPPTVASFDAIASASAACLRTRTRDIRRRGQTRALFVQLAYSVGSPSPRAIAEACGATVRTVRNLATGPRAPGFRAARLCLQDERLRSPDIAPAPAEFPSDAIAVGVGR